MFDDVGGFGLESMCATPVEGEGSHQTGGAIGQGAMDQRQSRGLELGRWSVR